MAECTAVRLGLQTESRRVAEGQVWAQKQRLPEEQTALEAKAGLHQEARRGWTWPPQSQLVQLPSQEERPGGSEQVVAPV